MTVNEEKDETGYRKRLTRKVLQIKTQNRVHCLSCFCPNWMTVFPVSVFWPDCSSGPSQHAHSCSHVGHWELLNEVCTPTRTWNYRCHGDSEKWSPNAGWSAVWEKAFGRPGIICRRMPSRYSCALIFRLLKKNGLGVSQWLFIRLGFQRAFLIASVIETLSHLNRLKVEGGWWQSTEHTCNITAIVLPIVAKNH